MTNHIKKGGSLTLVALLMAISTTTALGKQIKIYNGKNITAPDTTTLGGCYETEYIQKC
jgi:hypothetical protein